MAKEDRGFASMDRAKQREIASKGGKAAHQKGTAHEWTSEEARDAGRKGGIASHRRRREQMAQGNTATDAGSGGNESNAASDAGADNTDRGPTSFLEIPRTGRGDARHPFFRPPSLICRLRPFDFAQGRPEHR